MNKFEKFENFWMKKNMLKKVCKLKLPLYITHKPVNIIYKWQLDYITFPKKKNEVISLRRLKDMIRYKYLVQFSFAKSKNGVVNIFSATSVSPHDHNYWPYPQTTVIQSGYCSSYSPLFNAYSMIPWKCVFIFLYTNYWPEF